MSYVPLGRKLAVQSAAEALLTALVQLFDQILAVQFVFA